MERRESGCGGFCLRSDCQFSGALLLEIAACCQIEPNTLRVNIIGKLAGLALKLARTPVAEICRPPNPR